MISRVHLAIHLLAATFLTPVAMATSGDQSRINLALRYVVFEGPSGTPVLDRAQAARNLELINRVWGQCGVGFEIEDYEIVNPNQVGLPFHTREYSDLEDIRNRFRARDEMLVVVTGSWNRKGALGGSPANAWTAMPGAAPYGAVVEQAYGGYANIIAHELGHYLNLDHHKDRRDIMSAVIYEDSRSLTPEQCSIARTAAHDFWSSMQRPYEGHRLPSQLATLEQPAS
jgi:hypothetical protein